MANPAFYIVPKLILILTGTDLMIWFSHRNRIVENLKFYHPELS